ncbi:unnamed protein product [Leptidea sinapis]|uniref:Uncharacterized protein n=1 Tax=Leptidea sinapis TaxID=189913 RepID=A0A5E4QUK8_9NEOP|nr:unnamed protein product [Leptidea sinapis]
MCLAVEYQPPPLGLNPGHPAVSGGQPRFTRHSQTQLQLLRGGAQPRAHGRHHRPGPLHASLREALRRHPRFVVDGGVAGRRRVLPAGRSEPSSSSGEGDGAAGGGGRSKRVSHDSGVSDGSYVRRKQRSRK